MARFITHQPDIGVDTYLLIRTVNKSNWCTEAKQELQAKASNSGPMIETSRLNTDISVVFTEVPITP